MNILELILDSGLVAKLDIGFLFFLSLVSWTIIFYKIWVFKKAETENKLFLKSFSQERNISELKESAVKYKNSPLAITFLDGYDRLSTYMNVEQSDIDEMLGGKGIKKVNIKSLEKSLKFAGRDEVTYLEEHLPFLAVTSSVSPLLGLFGTVWGIMKSFHEIGLQANASISAVAPGIAEALVTTAGGLIAAIPAVVAYNLFRNKLRSMAVQINSFVNEFVEMVEDLSTNGKENSN